ncbi:MAG: hypothetical protein KDD44_02035 [Bdellovibrionales bacterium]|nr:hypothetical protein [Bdellovibrionales bacterium]
MAVAATEHGMHNGRESERNENRQERVRRDFEDITQVARDAAEDKIRELQKIGEEQTKVLKKRVQEDPLRSVLISAGVGFALGFILTRN